MDSNLSPQFMHYSVCPLNTISGFGFFYFLSNELIYFSRVDKIEIDQQPLEN
jgi:hypothetical protein